MKIALALAPLAVLVATLASCSSARHRAHDTVPSKFEVRVELVEAPASTVAGWIDAHSTKAKVVSSNEAESALSALRREGEVISRPKIVVSAGSMAKISKTDTVSYVREFTV